MISRYSVMEKILILGAGPAGLSAGVKLAEAGYPVEIFEASSTVGGLCKSFDLWGQRVDLGPHRFFSSNPEVNDFWRKYAGDDFTLVDRTTRIFYKRHFFDYPLKAKSLFKNLSLLDIFLCSVSYLLTWVKRSSEARTFEQWVTQRFGRKLYNIFFKSYTEKLWGLPGTEIDADWAAQRIQSLRVKDLLLGLLPHRNKKKGIRTLVDQFAYPNLGASQVYERMAEKILNLGGKIHLSTPVSQILLDKQNQISGIRLPNQQMISSKTVISTIPLNSLIRGIQSTPPEVLSACERLQFRNTILVYIEVDHDHLFPDNWIYIHSPDLLHGRITNFRNWSPHLYGKKNSSILCLEYWAFDSDSLWLMNDEDLARLAKKELRQTELLPNEVSILNAKVVRIRKSYPVYKINYKDHLKLLQEFVNSVNGLFAIGRNGSFKYNNQDHSIHMGLVAADQITSGTLKHNLWGMNSDQTYQESSSTPREWAA